MSIARNFINRKGSIVVEASIVLPVVIICIVGILYISILLYQQAYLKSMADTAAERGAVLWTNIARDAGTGKVEKADLDEAGLYWRLGLLDFNKEKKKEKIKKHLIPVFKNTGTGGTGVSRLGRFSLLYGLNEEENSDRITVNLVDYVIYKKLTVTLEERYRIPAGRFLSLFGINDVYTVRVRSEAVINDPAEFIRNTDFLADTERELEKKYPEAGRLGGKIRDLIGKIQKDISDFFERKEG